MKKAFQSLPWIALMVLALVSTPRSGSTAPPPERHPHIRGAMQELREARRELETGAHDFCGRRVQAIREIDATLEQLRLALDCDRR